MNRVAHLLVAASVASLVAAGYHRLLWLRLVRDTSLPEPWRTAATSALVTLGVTMVGALLLARLLPRGVVTPFAWASALWMGFSFLLLIGVLAGDLARLLVHVGEAAAAAGPAEPSRRTALARLAAGAIAALALAGGAVGLASALGPVAVKRVRVPLRKLPAGLHGLTIAQISDVHVGPTIGVEFVRRIVGQINALSPDLVAITGDLVDGSVAELSAHVAPLADLRARFGAFFVTGNHEYYSGAPEWVAELGRLGVRVLRNEHVAVEPEGATLDLAGVDDFTARGLAEGHGHDLPAALAGRDTTRACVLLAHQPRSAPEAARLGVDLQLSGHTHGGQIVPWNFLVRLQTPFVAGLYKLEETWVYVSRGTGYWGPPMRLGAPAEITLIELVREA